LVPAPRKRLSSATILATGGTAVLAALAVFAVVRSQLWLMFGIMGLLGLGTGIFSAAMPTPIRAGDRDSRKDLSITSRARPAIPLPCRVHDRHGVSS
jgi:hypothetical protein